MDGTLVQPERTERAEQSAILDEAIRQAELRLAAQAQERQVLEARATATTAWALTLTLALATGLLVLIDKLENGSSSPRLQLLAPILQDGLLFAMMSAFMSLAPSALTRRFRHLAGGSPKGLVQGLPLSRASTLGEKLNAWSASNRDWLGKVVPGFRRLARFDRNEPDGSSPPTTVEGARRNLAARYADDLAYNEHILRSMEAWGRLPSRIVLGSVFLIPLWHSMVGPPKAAKPAAHNSTRSAERPSLSPPVPPAQSESAAKVLSQQPAPAVPPPP